MGSRLFDQLDVINIVEGFTVGPSGSVTATLGNVSFSNFSLSNVAAGANYHATYTKSGDVDFTTFPAIPTTARITKVIHRAGASSSCDLEATSPAGSDACSVTLQSMFLLPSQFVTETPGPATPAIAQVTGFDTISGVFQTDEFNPAIDYATFLANYTNIVLALDVQFTCSPGVGGTTSPVFSVSWSDWSIEVFWTDAFQWTLSYDTPAEPLVSSATVTSHDTPDGLILKDLTVSIVYDDGGGPITVPVDVITTQDDHLLIFVMPDFPTDVFVITVIVEDPTGTQFTGPVPLGDIPTIFFRDPSGIYRLVADKTSDTFYIQDADPVTTLDVKIPNPFIKTGFIP